MLTLMHEGYALFPVPSLREYDIMLKCGVDALFSFTDDYEEESIGITKCPRELVNKKMTIN